MNFLSCLRRQTVYKFIVTQTQKENKHSIIIPFGKIKSVQCGIFKQFDVVYY